MICVRDAPTSLEQTIRSRKFSGESPPATLEESRKVKKTYVFAICLAALAIATIAIASIAGTGPDPSQRDSQQAGMMSIPF